MLPTNVWKKICRSCLRTQGIEFKEGDSGDVMEEIEKCYNFMGIPFNENKIDRAPFFDNERKKKYRPILVKFKSWKRVLGFMKLDQKTM